jgi:hypothetical protein
MTQNGHQAQTASNLPRKNAIFAPDGPIVHLSGSELRHHGNPFPTAATTRLVKPARTSPMAETHSAGARLRNSRRCLKSAGADRRQAITQIHAAAVNGKPMF